MYFTFKGGYTALSKAPANAVSASNIKGGMLTTITIFNSSSTVKDFTVANCLTAQVARGPGVSVAFEGCARATVCT